MKNKEKGFTSLELLVCVGIVTVLAAIFLPVLSSSRNHSKKALCKSNLRQLAFGVQNQLQDGSSYPQVSEFPSLGPEPVESSKPLFAQDIFQGNLGYTEKLFKCPNDVPSFSERESPNTGRSYFDSEHSSYLWTNWWVEPWGGKAFWIEYEPFHGKKRMRSPYVER
ncbi:MAG: type II secretion system GspH family protein [Nanoarchaeota archaeon]|nr:type II secretion system GspH family protein [Nanoarchaeota archaeon]MBU1051328.1 type II secretion system GspH family protein [Nanoarchaeota archaeon]